MEWKGTGSVDRDGMEWIGTGWAGMERDGMGWDGMEVKGVGWNGTGRDQRWATRTIPVFFD